MSLSDWSAQNYAPGAPAPAPAADLPPPRRYVETMLAEARDRFAGEFDADALLRPDPDDLVRGREIVGQVVASFQRRLDDAGLDPVADPGAAARRIMDDIMGLGPLQPLLDDDRVEEVIVNAYDRVFAIRGGRKTFEQDVRFRGEQNLRDVIDRILAPLGRHVSSYSPMVDARLAGGERINVTIPPLVSNSTLVIRKFLLTGVTLDALVRGGSITSEAAEYLSCAVLGGLNVLVAGGTGAGKTTFLNALGMLISRQPDERVITIENTLELQITRYVRDSVAFESRPANAEGAGEITVRDLVRNSLRMRPTRIIVGEVRGGEALDMIGAMNSGHEGSMCTIHSNDARSALSRLATYIGFSENLPESSINALIAEAIDIVVHLRQDHASGARFVDSVFEVTGVSERGSSVTGSELFVRRNDELVRNGNPGRALDKLRRGGWEGVSQ